jgi:hypothetical protein
MRNYGVAVGVRVGVRDGVALTFGVDVTLTFGVDVAVPALAVFVGVIIAMRCCNASLRISGVITFSSIAINAFQLLRASFSSLRFSWIRARQYNMIAVC